jgi:hypothetical protein
MENRVTLANGQIETFQPVLDGFHVRISVVGGALVVYDVKTIHTKFGGLSSSTKRKIFAPCEWRTVE